MCDVAHLGHHCADPCALGRGSSPWGREVTAVPGQMRAVSCEPRPFTAGGCGKEGLHRPVTEQGWPLLTAEESRPAGGCPVAT